MRWTLVLAVGVVDQFFRELAEGTIDWFYCRVIPKRTHVFAPTAPSQSENKSPQLIWCRPEPTGQTVASFGGFRDGRKHEDEFEILGRKKVSWKTPLRRNLQRCHSPAEYTRYPTTVDFEAPWSSTGWSFPSLRLSKLILTTDPRFKRRWIERSPLRPNLNSNAPLTNSIRRSVDRSGGSLGHLN